MIDYSYIITKTKELSESTPELSDMNLSFLHFIFPIIESIDEDLLSDCNEEIPAKNVKITGYYCNVDENYIAIYLSIFDQFATSNQKMSQNEFGLYKQSINNFVKMINDNSYHEINEGRPLYDLCDYIVSHREMELIFNIVTNFNVPLEYDKDGNEKIANQLYGIRTYDVIDIIDKLNSDNSQVNTLNLKKKFGDYISAVKISSTDEVDVYLTAFPGAWIAQLYKEDSIGLLSANVRSYLKRTNKVNREIINTVRELPQEFVAYNNGLSAIASSIKTKKIIDDKFLTIEQLDNFLIVNGGQTTATLYECRNDKLDLSEIIVPAKLSVIKNIAASEDIISNISIYSNSQTAIKKSDPPSNMRFYKMVEELSKNILANKNMKEYHCFFERTNGQYNTLKRMHNKKSDPFLVLNPEKAKFTKLQLAQAIVSWEQRPDLVCRGSEKNFEYFNDIVGVINANVINETYFKVSYALIIIYRYLDQFIKKQGLPYKASLVTYSLALLSVKCDKHLDLLKIWENQSLDSNLEKVLSRIVTDVYEHMIDSPKEYPDIRMWSRKSECWSHIQEISIEYEIEKYDEAWNMFPENNAKIFIDQNFSNIQVWKEIESWMLSQAKSYGYSKMKMIHAMPAIIFKGKVTKKQESYAKSIFIQAVEDGFDYLGMKL